MEGLDLIAGLGYIDARFDRFRVARTGERFDGNDIQLIPPYTFSVAMQYRHRHGGFARVEYQGLGGYSFFEDNARGQTAYELLNARVGYERAGIGVSLLRRTWRTRATSRSRSRAAPAGRSSRPRASRVPSASCCRRSSEIAGWVRQRSRLDFARDTRRFSVVS